MIEDYTEPIQKLNLNSVESVTDQLSTLKVQNSQLCPDTLLETESQISNLSEDDAIKYAAALIASNINTQQMTGAIIIRRFLCKETNIPFQKIIQSNILPLLIQLISNSDEEFAFEVLWIISNIAIGDKTCIDYLLSQRSIELFNYFLEKSSSIRIFSQMLWAIGNIAGEDPAYRDILLNQLDFQKMIYFLNAFEQNFSESDMKTIAWCITNLNSKCQNPDVDKIKLFLPILQKIIINYSHNEIILEDAMNSYAFITGKFFGYFDSQTLYKILSLLEHKNTKIVSLSLKSIGNYITTDNIDQHFIFATGLIPR